MAVAGVLVLAVAATSRAESADVQPAALSEQRAALYLKATHAPLADLEPDVNHLAILSETCRVQHGSQACGLPGKPLESAKLEERYAYYVRQPLEAHSKGQKVKIDRRNWLGSSAQ
jgi:cytochrome c5